MREQTYQRYPVRQALIDQYRREYSDTSVLAFSRGKDSITAALVMRDHLDIVPVHYFMVPGLPFVEESLDYFERKLFGRRILRFPHPGFQNWLAQGVHQTLKTFDLANAVNWSYPIPVKNGFHKIGDYIRKDENLDDKCLDAVGVKRVDSPLRSMVFAKHGPLRPTRRSWYPVWDYTKADLLDTIRKSDIKLPIDYRVFGRSFDGLHATFLVPMKKYLPADYKYLCGWFPLAEVEVWKYERQFGKF